MTPRKSGRRGAGEGGISAYETKAGTRYLITAWVTVDGERKRMLRRGYLHIGPAREDLRKLIEKDKRGELLEPSQQPLGDYLGEWLDGLRLAPATVASYRRNVRVHIVPKLGGIPLAKLTTAKLSKTYREWQDTGRADAEHDETRRTRLIEAGRVGLSARTVLYLHTILRSALQDAVDADQLSRNPAQKANHPRPSEARAPEMHVWDAAQLRQFLTWAEQNDTDYVLWLTLAMTGCRRGEVAALRWRDLDPTRRTLAVRRAVTVAKVAGQPAQVGIGPTKGKSSRVVDLDDGTVAALVERKKARGEANLTLAKPDALVFGDLSGRIRTPDAITEAWDKRIRRFAKALGDDAPHRVRVHDLRHVHASLLLARGVPVKVVSERLGHASPVITMSVYQHVLPGAQREAADGFAAEVFGG